MPLRVIRRLVNGVKDRALRGLATALRPYLARTPLFWGDRSRVTLGRNVHLVNTILNCRSGRVTIEDDVFFGHDCQILTGFHDYTKRGLARQTDVPDSGRDVIIRQGAWIASNVVIIGPCDIGRDAVVCAGSVVTSDLEAGAIHGGAPARKIKDIVFR